MGEQGKFSVVARLPGTEAGDLSDAIPSSSHSSRSTRLLVQTLLDGLCRLIEGQQQFADEFGLGPVRVFPHSSEHFEGRSPRDVLHQWFRAGDESVPALRQLFEDMMQHQLALMGGLDGVAVAALQYTSAEAVRQAHGGRLLTSGRAWKRHNQRVQELLDNPNLRFQRVLAPGFLEQYIRRREGEASKSDKQA